MNGNHSLSAIATALGFVLSAGLAAGQTPLHTKVSVDYRNLAAAEALKDLGARAGVRFEYDAELMTGLHPVTCKVKDQEAGRIAMRILYPRGLKLGALRGNRVRIVKRDPLDELRPRREETYEFAQKPTVTREGDAVTIAFETEGFCDVTVAIEDGGGRILRHLASGVLGPNAPESFLWNSKAQTLVWDGKDDAGVYVDDKDRCVVRVSLGLKSRFERTLYWSPERRAGNVHAMAAGPDGVYVFDSGRAFDHIRLFDRDGRYVRTVYPFPAEKLESIPDLIRHRLPDGSSIPIKPNMYQSTLLKSGHGFSYDYSQEEHRYRGKGNTHDGKGGWSGRALAVRGRRLALTGTRLSRMAADGSSGGLGLHGPDVARRLDKPVRIGSTGYDGRFSTALFIPRRSALSPDGQWLYVTRRARFALGRYRVTPHWEGHTVQRMAFADGARPEDFLGTEEPGSGKGEFNMPLDVATDAEGRIYVADHGNHRVQVFSPDGEWLSNVDVKYPALVSVHHRTGEIYVFCAPIQPGDLPEHADLPATRWRLHKFAPLDRGARPAAVWNLPMKRGVKRNCLVRNDVVIDSWSDPPRIWLNAGRTQTYRKKHTSDYVIVLEERADRLVSIRDFRAEAMRSVRRLAPPPFQRQRLYVNPADGMLYVGEGTSREGKSFDQVIRIDPRTGRLRKIDLPLNSEDMAFDRDGHIYLRTHNLILRYRPDTWREVPFDYGEERRREGYSDGGGDRTTAAISGALFPGNRGWHQGGMHVNARGDIVVGALYEVDPGSRLDNAQVHATEKFEPRMYPGRRYDPGGRFGGILVHVLDRHGQMLHADAVPGLIHALNGVALDADRRVYLLAHRTRAYDGKAGWNPLSGTLIRLTPGQNRILSAFGAPVSLDAPPDRPPDLRFGRNRGRTWVEGAHWFYGGGGWGGHNSPGTSLCSCHNSRFTLDDFARSFTPEIDRYNVGVVDSAGNLILRVGQYGNVDDGMPLVKKGGPPNPRSIGGDEVALFHPAYVATHTDRRLFIADAGNARIVSVKLGYHATESVALKDAAEGKGPDTREKPQ